LHFFRGPSQLRVRVARSLVPGAQLREFR